MERLIHILHVFPTFSMGGAQVRFANLANAFGATMRHSILAINGGFEATQLLDAGTASFELIDPPARPRAALVGWHYAQLIRRLRPDVLQTYNWGAIDTVIGGRLAGVCRVIHTEDGFGADEVEGLKTRRVLTRRILLNGVHGVVVPSRTLQQIALRQYKLRPHIVRFIPNGVDVEKFQPARDRQLRLSLGLGDGFVIGTVGRLRKEKNLGLLLRAFRAARLERAKLVIVGDGACREEWIALASRLNMTDRVVFAGEMLDVAHVYRVFDLFAMSSSTEQMPLSLLEAMSSGLPCVCTDVGDSASILDCHAVPEIVPKDDATAYADALRELASNESLRLKLGGKNRLRCQNVYSIEKMLAEWKALYREASCPLGSRLGRHGGGQV